jgi:hypothetical protein
VNAVWWFVGWAFIAAGILGLAEISRRRGGTR